MVLQRLLAAVSIFWWRCQGLVGDVTRPLSLDSVEQQAANITPQTSLWAIPRHGPVTIQLQRCYLAQAGIMLAAVHCMDQ